jgi:hypothetical protein
MSRDVGQRLAAERSPEVAQKNEEHRRAPLEFIERRRQLPAPMFVHAIFWLLIPDP